MKARREFNMDSMYRKCAICGKEFRVYDVPNFKYKDMIGGNRAYFCSYTCYTNHKKGKGKT